MKVLYISTNFTALSHTFITREIQALRERGVDVHLLSVRTPGTSAATSPECDLSDCRFIYPTPVLASIWGSLKLLFGSPNRFLRGLKVAVVSPDDSLKKKLKLLYQFAVVCRFVDWVQACQIDHIHSHFAGSPTSFAMFLSALTDRPFTFTDHGAGIFHDRIGLATKFRRAAGISAISEFNIQFYSQVVKKVPPVKIVRCGLKMDRFEFRQRERCATPAQILAVSRIVPKKGFSYLLDGLALLDREGHHWRCTFVGEGPLVPELQRQAAALGLADRVVFTGPKQQVEIRRLMGEADMFVLPCVVAPDGDMDGIPVTLMEAMACGCPVVSTNISGVPELVIDEQTGLLLEPNDGRAVGRAMARLISEPDLVAKLSRGGRDWVDEEFNISKSAQRISAFFAEIAATPKEN